MNKFTRIAILATVSLATLASTLELASARDRHPHWRKHQNRHFHGRVVTAGVLGLTAGVVIGHALSEPRVVYRPRAVYRPGPVIFDEGPIYDDEAPVYAEPDAEYDGPVEAGLRPMDDQDTNDQNMDDQGIDDQATNGDYFPEAPQAKRNRDVANRGTLEPWSEEWRSYCAERFQSFNPKNGTYRGYDGQDHFCTAG